MPHPVRLRASLATKLGLAVLLVAVSDLVIRGGWTGAACAVLAAAAVLAVAAARPAALRGRLGRAAMAAAAVFAMLPIERPGPLGWLLLAGALATASLALRARRGDDALGFALRIAAAAVRAPAAPFRDLRRVGQARRRAGRRDPAAALALARLLALPLAGGVTFAALFAAANPVLGQAVARLSLPQPDLPRLALWAVVAVGAWLLLRPRGQPTFLRRLTPPAALGRERASAASVVLSLVLFNGLFALQNGLDVAYLWSGARLPAGMSFAEYAHRGAYPLILTALLAGAFVLVFLRPGSEAAASRATRGLVIAWVAQNVFLVTSTALRTLAYVDAYSLTRLRIAALAWMALVAVGLALIGWRLLHGKSSGWLINANAAAAGLVLALCALLDLGAVAAAWNVRHAREFGTGDAALDLCYLRQLGPAAVVPLSELAQRPLPPALQARVANLLSNSLGELAERQADWRRWTWRGERRLQRAYALAGAPAPARSPRCDWHPSAQPLTPAPQLGS